MFSIVLQQVEDKYMDIVNSGITMSKDMMEKGIKVLKSIGFIVIRCITNMSHEFMIWLLVDMGKDLELLMSYLLF